MEKPEFLVTTAIKEFCDERKSCLFLGEGCLPYGETPPLYYEVLENPWNDIQSMRKARKYCADLFPVLLETLGTSLNQIHNEQHSFRYWEIILGPWLRLALEAVYDRYVLLSRAFSVYPSLNTFVLGRESFVVPTNCSNFWFLILNDGYNLQIYSQILEILGKQFPSYQYKILPYAGGHLPSFSMHLKSLLRGDLERLWGKLFTVKPIIFFDVPFNFLDMWRLRLALRFQVCHRKTRFPRIAKVPIDFARRKELSSISFQGDDEFAKCFQGMLGDLLPTAYIEDYRVLRNQTSIYHGSKAKVIVSALGWKSNEYFKFVAADAVERGVKLVGVQHGGSSGLMEYSLMDTHIMNVVDSYFSWGWESKSKAVIEPLPNPSLSKLFHKPTRGASGNVLFVGTNFPRYLASFRTGPNPSQMPKYFNWQISFFLSIPENLRPQFLVRLYSYDLGWRNRARLEDAVGQLKFDSAVIPFVKRLDEAKLVIVDNCQTAFLESMVRNRPTILFYDPVLWSMNEFAKGILDQLIDVNILHFDPIAAARHATSIIEKPEDWWGQENVQSKRREFIDALLVLEENWTSLWKRTILKHLSDVLG